MARAMASHSGAASLGDRHRWRSTLVLGLTLGLVHCTTATPEDKPGDNGGATSSSGASATSTQSSSGFANSNGGASSSGSVTSGSSGAEVSSSAGGSSGMTGGSSGMTGGSSGMTGGSSGMTGGSSGMTGGSSGMTGGSSGMTGGSSGMTGGSSGMTGGSSGMTGGSSGMTGGSSGMTGGSSGMTGGSSGMAVGSSSVMTGSSSGSAGGSSSSSGGPVGLAAPDNLAVSPASPANNNAPRVLGTAPAGSTVTLFLDDQCTMAANASGTAADFETMGFEVMVVDDSVTTFFAQAALGADVSACSASGVIYAEDSTVPDAPVPTGTTPASPSSNPAPAVVGTAESGATVSLHADSACTDAALGTGNADENGNFTVTLAASANQVTTVFALATDAAGNASTCSATSVSYTHDDTAPEAPVLTGTNPASPNSSANPEVLGTAEAAATVVLFDGADCTGNTLGEGVADAGGAFAIDVAAAPNASLAIHALAVDPAGNLSVCAGPLTYVHDDAAPALATLVSSVPASPSSEISPVISGTAESDATVTLHATADCSDAPLASTTAAGDGTFSSAVTVAANATTTLHAQVVDAAGNSSGCSTSALAYTHDDTAPSAPTLAGTTPPATGSTAMPAVQGTAEMGGSVTIFASADCSGAAAATGPVDASGAFSLQVTAMANAANDYSARAVDAAGNLSDCSPPVTYVHDDIAPAEAVLTGTSPASPSSTTANPAIQGTAEPSATVLLFTTADCSGNPTANGTADGAGVFSIPATVQENMTTTFHAQVRDAAGNLSPCSTTGLDFVHDNSAPATPALTKTTPVSPSSTNTNPSVEGTAEAGVTVSVFTAPDCGGTALGSGTADPSGAFIIAVTVPADSATTLYARASDAAGNVSGCSQPALTYVHDATAPAAPEFTGTNPASPHNNNLNPSILGTAELGSTVSLFTNPNCTGNPVQTGMVAGDGTFTIAVTVGQNSSTTYFATARDAAGNTSACTPNGQTYTHDNVTPPLPVFTGTNPTSPSSNNTTPFIQGNSEAGSTVELYDNATCSGTALATGTTAADETFSIQVTVGDNTITTFKARAVDGAGNRSFCSTASITYQHDSTVPNTPVFMATVPASPSNASVTPVLNGTAGPNLHVDVYTTADCSGTAVATGTCDGSGVFNIGVNVAANSSTTFRARARTGAGSLSACTAVGITYVHDNLAPVLNTLRLAGGADFTRTTVVKGDNTATDGTGSGLAEFCYSTGGPSTCVPYGLTPDVMLPAGDGLKTVNAQVRDAAGNFSTFVSDTITLDTVAPTLAGILINGNAARTTSVDVNIRAVNAADSNSVATIMFSTDGGNTFGAPLAFNALGHPFTLPSGDGTVTVHGKVADPAGNESVVHFDSIILDTTPPTGTVVLANGAAAVNTTNITLQVNATDAGSNVVEYCARESSTRPPTNDPCWRSYVTTDEFFMLSGANGTKTVYAWFKDGAGLISATAATDTIILDTVPPTLSTFRLNNGAAYTNNRLVTANNSASDGTGSGLAEVCRATSTSGPFTCGSYNSAPTFLLTLGDGLKTIYLRVEDLAGNQSVVLSDSITLDRTRPVLSAISINSGDAYATNADVSITATASDANGVAEIAFSTDGGVTFGAFVAYVASGTAFTLPAGDGNKVVHAKVRDVAGNESASPFANDAIFLDVTRPTGTITINNDDTYTNSTSVTLTLTRDDGVGSGVTQMCVKNSTTTPTASDPCWMPFNTTVNNWILFFSDGTRLVSVWFMDAAGLMSARRSDTIILDTVAPTVPGSVQVLAGHRELTVSWTASTDTTSGLAGYRVGLSTTSGGSYSYGPVIPAGTETANITLLANGVRRYVVVRAVDNAGNVVDSSESSGTPRYPFNFAQRQPAGVTFNAVRSFSSTTAVAAGSGGTVFTTVDGWNTSIRRDPLHDSDIRGMIESPGGRLIAVADDGFISGSGDNGNSWYTISNSQPAPRSHLYGVAYTHTAGSGFFVTEYFLAVGEGGTLLRGSMGVLLSGFAPLTSPTTNTLRSVARCETCTTTVVAVGDSGTIIRSTDNGTTWTTITPPTGYATADFRVVAGVPGSNQMYIGTKAPDTGRAGLLRSVDGGVTWTEVAGTTFSVYSVHATDSLRVWAAGADLVFLLGRSVEMTTPQVIRFSGSTVTTMSTPSGAGAARAIHALDGSNVTWAGLEGQVVRTTNGGGSWLNESAGTSSTLQDIAITPSSPSRVWAVGEPGRILSSTNGGFTWTSESAGSSATFYGVAAPSSSAVFAVGLGGAIVSDGFFGFTTVSSPVSADLFGISCASTTTCYAVGADKAVVRYNGSSWTVVNLSSGSGTYRAVKVYMAGSTPRGIAVGTDGVLRTLANTTWTERANITGDPDLLGVSARADGVALAVGLGGKMFRSIDHGVTWTDISSASVSVNLYDVAPGSGNSWYAVGEGGAVFKTDDNGGTWMRLVSSTRSNTLHAVDTVANIVLASGSAGIVLRSDTEGE